MPSNIYAPPQSTLDLALDSTANTPAPPLWNPAAIAWWSLLLTPVFGWALSMKNWRALGDDGKARTARNWLIFSCVILVPTLLMAGLHFIYFAIWYFVWQKKQITYVQQNWGADYPRKGWIAPLLWSIGAFWLATTVFAVLVWTISTLVKPVAGTP